jgi:glycosyltransferase involved in cell wall biosynthesis
VQPGEYLVCNIGTISDRKGQHAFARAVDLLWRRHPQLAARTRFVLLGGRDTPFDTMLGDALAELGRPNLIVHPETTDYLRYYLAADLFACSSYEESSPRVVFEAMALRAPILASAVHGVPELVRDGLEACLLPPGDTVAWCESLARLLATPSIGLELAARARARAESSFAAPAVMPRHLALVTTAAAFPR